ncbi:hypothetical protein COCSUDRAFT_30891 [Coccomyxa subellipsoidea C-169]|uniref:Alpha N-terminal protein methyltransferase 1 n=1 Tax=Coccomyxa subellipsoidea (strain C-169) TaxID=574566 RepID=I0YN61_COCSC|nr:hypothetical protein COCSUDRAFT_30891 [Coccomyxa subellipsoidea C-169]EIE19830.1 hypothetical protein COCSUDRAFT_30891 [Coccomyxa subellipsoidea C-169]|eukprot:XP_005644374.1 hypothetical protein COCSUDRAFT_30891 [Coccomyxa subellipsoidea C-169]
MDCTGFHPEGKVFENPKELWKTVEDDKEKTWYAPAVEYWDKQPASYDGVLAGLGHLNGDDIADSRKFIRKVFDQQLQAAESTGRRLVAADCGAGVGRVTEQLLLHHCAEVDLVEPSKHLLETAQRNLTSAAPKAYPAGHRAAAFLHTGLQGWNPEPQRYDLIWIQWALLYLTDDDLLALLERCKGGLKPGGLMIFKENVCENGFVVDPEDSSVTRSDAYLLDLLKRAGYTLRGSALQRNFPKGLFKVRMYAAQPKE